MLPRCLSASQMLDLSLLCRTGEHNIRPGLTRHSALAVEWLEAVEAILTSLPGTKHLHQLETVERDLMMLRLQHDQKWRWPYNNFHSASNKYLCSPVLR